MSLIPIIETLLNIYYHFMFVLMWDAERLCVLSVISVQLFEASVDQLLSVLFILLFCLIHSLQGEAAASTVY